jgi:26S proteasome regulatory subunit N2
MLPAFPIYLFLAKAIDHYILVRNEQEGANKDKVDPKLQFIIEGIFDRCVQQREYKQVRPNFLPMSDST